jgi:hypothetical protein
MSATTKFRDIADSVNRDRRVEAEFAKRRLTPLLEKIYEKITVAAKDGKYEVTVHHDESAFDESIDTETFLGVLKCFCSSKNQGFTLSNAVKPQSAIFVHKWELTFSW